MSGKFGWTKAEKQQLIELASSGKLFYSEIASKIGRRPAAVRYMARKLELAGCPCPSRFAEWNRKHSHLREQVMRYFVNHTAEECKAKFGLTSSEFKSLMTIGYRIEKFKGIRKDKRRHDPWSAEELRYMLTRAGLVPRAQIAQELKRGSYNAVKDRLADLNVASKNLNGLSLSQFRELFGHEPALTLETHAGPIGGWSHSSGHWRIVPWVWMDHEIRERRLKAPAMIKKLIHAMALFQEWIHNGNALSKMKKLIREAA